MASKKLTSAFRCRFSRKNSRTNSRPARPSSRMLMGPKVHSAMDTQSVMPVAKAAAGISSTGRSRSTGGSRPGVSCTMNSTRISST